MFKKIVTITNNNLLYRKINLFLPHILLKVCLLTEPFLHGVREGSFYRGILV